MKQDTYARFPFFVDIHNWKILVIGGGVIASRRIRVLLSFGPAITLVCPEAASELRQLAGEKAIRWEAVSYEEEILDREKWNLVLAATDDAEINQWVCASCRERGIPVNNAGDQKDCDFFFPAIITGKGMIIGLVSDGSDHHAVRKAAAKIREEFGENNND